MPFGLTPRDLVSLARESSRVTRVDGAIAVSGPGADELGAALSAGGRAGVVSAHSTGATHAVIRILEGSPNGGDEDVLRRATRAGAVTVAVVRGRDADADADRVHVPYVLATDVVPWPSGRPVPTAELAQVLVAALGDAASPLAAALPVLRPALEARATRATATTAAGLALLGARSGAPLLPVLALLQARMLRKNAVARGDQPPAGPNALTTSVAPELAGALALGLVGRTLVRRLPVRSRVIDAAVAYAGTTALGLLASRASALRPPAVRARDER